MTNPNKEIFEYRGQCTAEYYNQFFNPNLCHVCKSVDKGNLILCDQCCLISYCSEEHKMIHHPYHEKICAIIAQIVQVKPQKDTCKFSDWQQWVQSRKLLMELVQNELDDKMEPYVQHMILWPKSCYICHQQVKLQVCQRCFSANYCDKHANAFRTTHNGVKCDRLVLLLNTDIETISDNTKNISYGFLRFVNETSCFTEMLEFCMEYILVRRRRDIDWLAKDYVRSDYLSGPLTVYSGFKRAQLFHILKEEYIVIHIIASNSIKKDSLPAWEILLHLIPEIRKLHIIMVGSELTDYFGQHSLCKRCTDAGKGFSYVSIPMLYHVFVQSSKKYMIPNVILGSQIKFDKGNLCVASIREIAFQECMLCLSVSSEQEIKIVKMKIEEAVGRYVVPYFNDRNYFSGLAPHKNLETGDTYFCNEYIIIYYDLYYDGSRKASSSYT